MLTQSMMKMGYSHRANDNLHRSKTNILINLVKETASPK